MIREDEAISLMEGDKGKCFTVCIICHVDFYGINLITLN